VALAAYLSIIDEHGQPVRGDVQIAGRLGTIEVISHRNSVFIDTDPDTHVFRSRRYHSPFIILTELGSHTPYFFDAVKNGRCWQQATIDTYHMDKLGNEYLSYQVKLEQVRVGNTSTAVMDVKDKLTRGMPEMNYAYLVYEKITRLWLNGNIESIDDVKH